MKLNARKIGKVVVVIVGLLVVLAVGGFAYVELTWSLDHPNTPYPELASSSDPAIVARGEYLVDAVAHCSTCHQGAALVKEHRMEPGQPLQGGFHFEAGPFGTFVAANITPDASGIGNMSDRDLARVLRHAVNSKGQLLPFMRIAVGTMADEDIVAIMSYLRAQQPVSVVQPKDELGFIGKLVSKKLEPRMVEPPPFVREGGISVERGRYLAEGPALCIGCHTPADPMDGFKFSGPAFSGAAEADPDPYDETMIIQPPNLTPAPKTGHIKDWSEDAFVTRFRQGRVIKGSKMPWDAYSRMTDEDLRSIYRFLQTVPAAEHEIGPTYRKAD